MAAMNLGLSDTALGASPEDRSEVVAFAEWSVGMHALRVHQHRQHRDQSPDGGKFTFGFDGQAICSGLVARALERTKAIFNRTPSHIMPADLAMYFQTSRYNGEREAEWSGWYWRVRVLKTNSRARKSAAVGD